MTTQYTPTLKLALPVTGELSGTWGDVVNDNITSMIEQAIAGLSTINTWTANVHTLTTANGTTSESRCAMLVAATGTGGTALTAAGEIICPAAAKLYVLRNTTAFAITLKTSAGTGVAVAASNTAFLFCDGTNVNACVTTIVDGNVTGNLTVGGNATINGNTTLGDATSDTITATARFNTDLLPSTDNARDLGSTANSWKDLYIDGTATIATLNVTTIDTTNLEVTNIKAKDGTASIALADSTGVASFASSIAVDGTTDSSSTTTGSIQTDGGVGIAKALFVGTTVTAATLNLTNALGTASGGTGLGGATPFTANGVVYASSTSALATGSALVFDGSKLGVGTASPTFAIDVENSSLGIIRIKGGTGTNQGGSFFVQFAGSTNTLAAFGDRARFFGGTPDQLVSLTSAVPLTFDVNGSEQARLTSSGLEIKQSQLIGYSSYAGIGTNGLAVAGNVGVGTASPGAQLDISTTVSATGAILRLSNQSNTISVDEPHGTIQFFSGDDSGTADTVVSSIISAQATTAPNEGYLKFLTGNNTEKLRIDSAGNLGLGVTPSALWRSGERAFQVGPTTCLTDISNFSVLRNNNYVNSAAQEIYLVSGTASAFVMTATGQYQWLTAPSGTAGNAISFTQAMTLTAGGNLLLGNTGGTGYRLNVLAAFASTLGGAYIEAGEFDKSIMVLNHTNASVAVNLFQVQKSGTGVLTLDASGNLVIGDTSTSSGLTLVRSGSTTAELKLNQTGTGGRDYRIGSTGSGYGTAGQLIFYDATAGAERGRFSDDGTFRVKGAGTAGSTDAFQVAGTAPADAARIDSSGNLLVGTSTPSAKLTVIGAAAKLYIDLSGDNYYDAANHVFRDFAGTERARIDSTGIVTMSAYGAGAATFSAAGVISSVSDETWKTKDGVPVDPDSMLKKLEPGYWFYNEEKASIFGADRQLGFYAQNVNAAIGPEAAPVPEEGKPWGYYDRSVLAVTVMSLQKALATIESLTARITALESSTLQ